MKNKKLTFILTLIILLGMAAPIFAATITQEGSQTGSTKLSYTVDGGYTIFIPADMTVTTEEKTEKVSASNVLLEEGKNLKVTMTTTNEYKLVCEESSIAYSIKKGENELKNATEEVLSVASGTTEGETELVFSTTAENISKATLSGEHTDVLTFTASVQ